MNIERRVIIIIIMITIIIIIVNIIIFFLVHLSGGALPGDAGGVARRGRLRPLGATGSM